MKTMVPTIGLSILLLSAGAFANNGSPAPLQPVKTNVTVVHKNMASPVLPPVLTSCEVNRCLEI